MAAEQWRPVLGLEGSYEVSSEGNVRSLDRIVERVQRDGRVDHLRQRGRVLPGALDAAGYRMVALGRRRRDRVHVLVAEAFIGPRPAGAHVLHRDDCKSNNAAENLRYGSPTENSFDRRVNGQVFWGEASANSKLTERDARCLLRLKETVSPDWLRQVLGLSKDVVARIGRLTWTHCDPSTVAEAVDWLTEHGQSADDYLAGRLPAPRSRRGGWHSTNVTSSVELKLDVIRQYAAAAVIKRGLDASAGDGGPASAQGNSGRSSNETPNLSIPQDPNHGR